MSSRTPAPALALASVLFSASCADQVKLPTAPSVLTEGVAIYEHAQFGGQSALLTTDVKDLLDVRGPCLGRSIPGGGYETAFGDCMSSVRLAPGWGATLFVDDGYGGQSLTVTADILDLSKIAGPCSKGGFNDCISSLRVYQR